MPDDQFDPEAAAEAADLARKGAKEDALMLRHVAPVDLKPGMVVGLPDQLSAWYIVLSNPKVEGDGVVVKVRYADGGVAYREWPEGIHVPSVPIREPSA